MRFSLNKLSWLSKGEYLSMKDSPSKYLYQILALVLKNLKEKESNDFSLSEALLQYYSQK